jgi:beta-mannosidase
MKGIFLFLVLISICSLAAEKRLPLVYWSLKPEVGKFIPVKTMAPSVVHLDLMYHYGREHDFYLGNNEFSALAKDIEENNWIYSTTFTIDKAKDNYTELVFEGLDTYADVYLNDSLVLRADNMFRSWIVPVGALLKDGENELEVRFISPLNYHTETLANTPYQLPSGNETGPIQVSCYTRKAAYQFGWDFAPRLVTCGIWKPCYLRKPDHHRITDVFVSTREIANDAALLDISFTILSDTAELISWSVNELENTGGQIGTAYFSNEISLQTQLLNPQLWYPNGYGPQNLYTWNIELRNENGELVLQYPFRFAIRTVELVNEPDAIGTAFYFKVNEIPVFAKGANYVPTDLFLPRVREIDKLSLLQKVRDANMNMIRVWGGGIYESDFFYTTCDELGIMVWQDFMFANSLYPIDSAFHANVRSEVDENVKRLRNHPSIVLWCGNNEIDVAWHNWGWQKQFGYSEKDSLEIWNNYQYIFEELIPERLFWFDPARPYISSSPQSNWGTEENFNHGAMHYWGVWHGREPIDSFKTNIGRFMVEYGFQSYPHWLTWEETRAGHAQSNIHPDSADIRKRQKSYIGDAMIVAEIEKRFGKLTRLQDWIKASQYVQAEALKNAIQAHRLNAPHCMGTLFWQLNDCWPGPSWSIIDYFGTKKTAYEVVQENFKPAIAIVDTANGKFTVTVQSEIPFSGYLLIGQDVKNFRQIPVKISVAPFEPKMVYSVHLKKFRKKYPYIVLDIRLDPSPGIDCPVFEDEFYFDLPDVHSL